MPSLDNNPSQTRGGDVLTISFGTVVAMAFVAYLCHMPLIAGHTAITFGLLIACMVAGGFWLGRASRRTWRGGLVTGLVVALVFLIFAGSMVSENPQALSASLPSYFAIVIGCVVIGQWLGRTIAPPTGACRANWPLRFALVGSAITFLTVIAGGLVTGHDAGMAFPDWPTSDRAVMFVYPLSKMTGGRFYEHAHRLVGALVGLTALAIAVYQFRVTASRRVRAVAIACLAMVVLQGVIGGLWVVFGAEQQQQGRPMPMPLMLFHGVFGQMTLALFTVLALMNSAAWSDRAQRLQAPKARADKALGVAAIVALLLQLVLGVLLRKHYNVLLEHIVFAFIVATLAIGLAIRASSFYGRTPILKRLAGWVSAVVVAQIALGFVALLARQDNPQAPAVGSDAVTDPTDALLTTLHQSTGAALLALVVTLTVGVFRFVHHPQPAKAAPQTPEVASAHA